jgi:hypothetical protein
MGVTVALAISNDVLVMSGPDVTRIRSGVLSWTLLGLMALAVFVLLFAAAAHFAAWIGAVLNTAHLPDKTWFVVLLVVGLLGFVFIATIAYVIAGPDGLKATEEASIDMQNRRRVSLSRTTVPTAEHRSGEDGGLAGFDKRRRLSAALDLDTTGGCLLCGLGHPDLQNAVLVRGRDHLS